MLEVAQHVQQFLHKHDRPHVSLYEEMLQRQRQKEEEEKKRLAAEREAWRIKEEEEVCVRVCSTKSSPLHTHLALIVMLHPPLPTPTHPLTSNTQHQRIEEEIMRKKAELRERVEQYSDEEEEDNFEVGPCKSPQLLNHVLAISTIADLLAGIPPIK